MAKLNAVTQLNVPASLAAESMRLLRESGLDGMEAIVLWAGNFSDDSNFDVEIVLRPKQTAYRTARGLLAKVDEDEIFRVNRLISDQGMRLVAQLHTHPENAYHSDTDDEFALVTARGALSIVVPFFASGLFDLKAIAVYRLDEANAWNEMSPSAVTSMLQIVEDE